MSAPTTSGTVHWIGAGRSTGPAIGGLTEQGRSLVVWSRNPDRARQRIDDFGIDIEHVQARQFDLDYFAGVVEPGDVVVSMAPSTEHDAILSVALHHGAHFVCSSYTSPAAERAAERARSMGVVVLTEAGLDPGVDHLFALDLIGQATEVVRDEKLTARFWSYCGGVPAVPNVFRYRFSWAPLGVLRALRSPARYVDGGTETTVERPWESLREVVLEGEAFEAYPNRDSVPYLEHYGFPSTWHAESFVRGTLRLSGWAEAWGEVFAAVAHGSDTELAALADELGGRHKMGPGDRDRVVLTVGVDLTRDGEPRWSGAHTLDMTGTADETAMSRCVTGAVVHAVDDVLDGRVEPGLTRVVADSEAARRWLEDLDASVFPLGTHRKSVRSAP